MRADILNPFACGGRLLLAAALVMPATAFGAVARGGRRGSPRSSSPARTLNTAAGAQGASPTPSDFGQLRPGDTVRQEIAGGDVHRFHVTLAEGQYVRADLKQEDLDVTVSFFGPDTRQASAVMDSPNGTYGPESVSVVARAADEYVIEVRANDRGAMPGRYELRLDGPREPTEADVKRVAAEAAFLEGRRLRRLGTQEGRAQAVEKYEASLALWRSLGDRHYEAYTLCNLGQIYRARGDLTKTRDYLTDALSVLRREGDLHGQALMNNELGAAVRELDSPQNAIPFYQKAYDLYALAGSAWGKAQQQNNMGFARALLGDYGPALELYRQALPAWQSLRDRNMEALTLNNIGGALEKTGDVTRALASYEGALRIWQETGRVGSLAVAYNNVGVIYHGFGDTQRALENYENALARHREMTNERGEANALDNIGMVYADMGDAERALEYFGQSLAIRRRINQPQGSAGTLDKNGYAHYLLGRYDEALALYQEAQQMFTRAQDKQGLAYTLTHTGMTYAAKGEPGKALECYQLALQLQKEIGAKLSQAITLDKLGGAYDALGNAEKAVTAFQEAFALWSELGEERGRAMSLYGLARIERARGDLPGARGHIEQAIRSVESIRARTANQHLRTTLLATRHNYYELDIDVKMRLAEQQGSADAYLAAAFEASERARARGLLDLLAEANADIRRSIKPELAAERSELEKRIGAVSDRLLLLRGLRAEAKDAARISGEVESLKKELDSLSNRYEDLQARIRVQSPVYARLTQPEPLKFAQVRALLDEDTLLLAYALGEQHSYVWAVTSAGVESYRLKGRAEIQQAAQKLRESLLASEPIRPGEDAARYVDRLRLAAQQYRQRTAELGALILAPLAGRLKIKRLAIIADGALQYIPFEVLPAPGGQAAGVSGRPEPPAGGPPPLGLNTEVVYLPSASALAMLRAAPRERPSGSVAVFADPVFESSDDRVLAAYRKQTRPDSRPAARPGDLGRALRDFDASDGEARLERLKSTLREANDIVSVTPAGTSMLAVSFAANRSAATSPSLGRYQIVHFATHALLDDRRPQLSGLVLSLVDDRGRPLDGFLRLNDIYNLSLPVDTVVLSACQTGVGKEVRGEGLIGLTRGFMYAGARRVVASLWKVEDEATAALMKSFYRHMLTERLPPAAALRLAKSDVMRAREQWRSPYYWAGFVLQGDWK